MGNLDSTGVPFVSLHEIVQIENRGVNKVDTPGESEVLLLNYLDVYRNHELDESIPKVITTASENQISRCDLRVGDILVTPTSETRDDLAHASVVVSEMPNTVYSYHVMRLRIFDFKIVDPKFLAYQFRSTAIQSQIIASANGITRFGLTKPKWEALKVQLPPIEVQKEIVRILDNFRELQRVLATEFDLRNLQLEKYRDDAMSQLDDSNSRWMPLKDCASIFDGTHQTPSYTSGGIKFVSVENIDALTDSRKFISPNDYMTLYKTKPKKGDLLMTRIGSVGRCAVIDTDEPLAYYVSLALVKPKKDLTSSDFIKHFLQSHSGRIELDKRTLHHAVPLKINLGDLGKVMIRIPDLRMQNRLTNFLNKLEELLYSNDAGIAAELSNRRKQYEYFLDSLLTFKNLEAS
jgi:type I restriction enzyme S subunit